MSSAAAMGGYTPVINPGLVPKLFVQQKTGHIRNSLVWAALVCSAQCLLAIVIFLCLDGPSSPPYFIAADGGARDATRGGRGLIHGKLKETATQRDTRAAAAGGGDGNGGGGGGDCLLLCFSMLALLVAVGVAWWTWSDSEARIKMVGEKKEGDSREEEKT